MSSVITTSAKANTMPRSLRHQDTDQERIRTVGRIGSSSSVTKRYVGKHPARESPPDHDRQEKLPV